MPTTDGVVLVDDKFAQHAPDIVARVKPSATSPCATLSTPTGTATRTGGNHAMTDAHAGVIITRQARANMVAGKQPGLPHLTFTDETRYFARGHTNGDAVVCFPGERGLYTGDLLVSSDAPFFDNANGGSIEQWDATIGKALELDFDTVIACHGPVAKKAAS
jgi:glyoxylase-like metal-dependent hydrolase (beta-lactamase superfamily II)